MALENARVRFQYLCSGALERKVFPVPLLSFHCLSALISQSHMVLASAQLLTQLSISASHCSDMACLHCRGVILLALERAPEDYTYLRHQSSNSLPAQASETLQVVDCFSDPLGWQDNQNPDSIPATLSDNESDRPRSSTQASREGQSHEEAGPSGRVHNVHGKIDFVRNGLSVVRFGGDRGLEELKAGIQRAGECEPLRIFCPSRVKYCGPLVLKAA